MVSQGLVGKKNPHPFWHKRGVKWSRAHFYELVARCCSERIITSKYLPRCFSPFCYGGGP